MPVYNPIGFATGDTLEFALAALLVIVIVLWGPLIDPLLGWLGRRTLLCMSVLAALPVILRLALLGRQAPVPDVYDEFGHLLVADTLRHFRLANPPHALPQFFETFFVLQRPTYSSIYPLGQGLALAFGWLIFGQPWVGVLLSTAALCALSYWMLLGWTTPRWALIGGLLAILQFGPFNQWTNSYWGGDFAATAGCLVFGSLPRLRQCYRTRDAILLGLGLAMHLLTRPFESIFFALSVILFWLTAGFPEGKRAIPPFAIAALVVTPAIGLMLLQNQRVTGHWTTLPYSLSQYQYGVPASLTFQPQAQPHQPLTREQDLDYRMQRAFRASERETLSSYLRRLAYRVRYYRFYLLPPLYIACALFLIRIRSYLHLWVAATVVLFALGSNFFPAFQYHYLAAIVCLFILMSVKGLELLEGVPARVILTLCLALAVMGFHKPGVDPRAPVYEQFARIQGKALVLVRYWPNHIFQNEWVYNAADIDGARVVMARDLGEPENEKIRQYYPDRSVWLLEPDAEPARLQPYQVEAPPPPAPVKKDSTPQMILEQVH